MATAIAFVVFVLSIFPSHGQDPSPVLCVKEGYVIPLFSSQILHITFNDTRLRQRNIHTISVSTSIGDHKVAEFENGRQSISDVFHLVDSTESMPQEPIFSYTFTIRAKYINRTSLQYSVEMYSANNDVRRLNCSITLTVSQPRRLIDKLFRTSLPFVIIIISIQMGVLLDTKVLKELVRRPIQVTIGFVCQYGLMPLLAWGITKIFRYEPLYGLGLFVVGCCPGGWASNQWTVLFDGDLNLSVFMSFASTVASFFMMPVWLYTLGQTAYLQQLKIRIPFFNLAQSLVTIIGPLAVGMLLVYCVPKLKPLVTRIVKPMLLILLLYFFVFGAFANVYLFRYIDLRTALTAPLLPWLGFLLGSCVAWICQQDWSRIKTIGIETGIQNVGIAFMVLLYSLPAPENSQACVMPLIVAYLCTQPFYLILIYRVIRRKFFKPDRPVRQASVDTLSKTSRQLSEEGAEAVGDNSSTPMALPVAAAGMSPNVEPVEV